MTPADLAEIERLLAVYIDLREKQPRACFPLGVLRARTKLETALVRHAAALIAAAKERESP